MIIYEVNTEVNNEIYDAYSLWLKEHVVEILQIEGFVGAEVAQVERHAEDKRTAFRVCFKLESIECLQNYLSQHATRLRSDAAERWSNQFSVTRRVLNNVLNYI